MLELGRTQELTVVKKVDFGIYLAETKDDEEEVLLPKKQGPSDRDYDGAPAPVGAGGRAYCGADREDRRFFGLGTGKGSVIAVSGADPRSTDRGPFPGGPLSG